jgi:hypothetical protein
MTFHSRPLWSMLFFIRNNIGITVSVDVIGWLNNLSMESGVRYYEIDGLLSTLCQNAFVESIPLSNCLSYIRVRPSYYYYSSIFDQNTPQLHEHDFMDLELHKENVDKLSSCAQFIVC